MIQNNFSIGIFYLGRDKMVIKIKSINTGTKYKQKKILNLSKPDYNQINVYWP